MSVFIGGPPLYAQISGMEAEYDIVQDGVEQPHSIAVAAYMPHRKARRLERAKQPLQIGTQHVFSARMVT